MGIKEEPREGDSIWDAFMWSLYRLSEWIKSRVSRPDRAKKQKDGSLEFEQGMDKIEAGASTDNKGRRFIGRVLPSLRAKRDRLRKHGQTKQGDETNISFWNRVLQPREDFRENDVSLLIGLFTLIVTIISTFKIDAIFNSIKEGISPYLPEPFVTIHAVIIVSLIAFFLICGIAVSSGLSIYGKIVCVYITYLICFLGFILSSLVNIDTTCELLFWLFNVIISSVLSVCGILCRSCLIYFVFSVLVIGIIIPIIGIGKGIATFMIIYFTIIELLVSHASILFILGNPSDRIFAMFILMWCVILIILAYIIPVILGK